MKALTQDENILALDQIIAANRAELARINWQLRLHQDVLKSPQDTVTQLETVLTKTGQALEWLETQRERTNNPTKAAK